MDQRHLAGVGNIYANEALFAAGIDPSKPAVRLTPERSPPAARGDPADPRGRDRLQRNDLPGLPHRHGRERQLPARAVRLRTRGRAVPAVRDEAHRYARHRRAASPSSATAASHEPRPKRAAGGAAAGDRSGPAAEPGPRRGREPARGLPHDATPPAGSSTSARPSGSAPGCSPISARSTRTTRARGFCTRRTTSPGTTCRASSPRTWASCVRSADTVPTSTTAATSPAGRCSSRCPAALRLGSTPAGRSRGTICAATVRSTRWAAPLEAVRTLNDLLGLRDCAAAMPIVFARTGRSLRSAEAGGLSPPRVRLLQRALRGVRDRAGVSAEAGDGRGVPRGAYDPAARPRRRGDAGGRDERATSSWRPAGEESSSSWSGCSPPPAGPAPRSICSPSSTATPATSATTGPTSSCRAWCGRRFPSPPRRSSARPSARSSPRSWRGRCRRPDRSRSTPIDEILLLMAWFRAHPDALRRTTPLAGLGGRLSCPLTRTTSPRAHAI